MALSENINDLEKNKFEEVDSKTAVRVKPVGKFFQVPEDATFFTVELANSSLDVVYKFRTTSISGPILKTITLHYNTAQTLTLTGGEIG